MVLVCSNTNYYPAERALLSKLVFVQLETLMEEHCDLGLFWIHIDTLPGGSYVLVFVQISTLKKDHYDLSRFQMDTTVG